MYPLYPPCRKSHRPCKVWRTSLPLVDAAWLLLFTAAQERGFDTIPVRAHRSRHSSTHSSTYIECHAAPHIKRGWGFESLIDYRRDRRITASLGEIKAAEAQSAVQTVWLGADTQLVARHAVSLCGGAVSCEHAREMRRVSQPVHCRSGLCAFLLVY